MQDNLEELEIASLGGNSIENQLSTEPISNSYRQETSLESNSKDNLDSEVSDDESDYHVSAEELERVMARPKPKVVISNITKASNISNTTDILDSSTILN